ncbi:MAG: hypothetical protein A2X90_08185 [Deltaproteobacteria bacterium GWA2_65_63]|nr:MAG: hypothetical protein A2X90_08185 [Deltaproteobacteria bacterium GWA2_65_63]
MNVEPAVFKHSGDHLAHHVGILHQQDRPVPFRACPYLGSRHARPVLSVIVAGNPVLPIHTYLIVERHDERGAPCALYRCTLCVVAILPGGRARDSRDTR